MAILGREFIAVPDDRKSQIVFKWPDVSIRRFTRAIVDADEEALFINKGAVVVTLPPGRHAIDADEIPGLGILIDHATGGNAYRAELYFVGTREYTQNRFGGRVDDVQDPHSGLIVTLRIFGQYAMKPVDPGSLVTNLTGTVDVTDNDKITDWISSQLLKVARTEITRQIVQNGWPLIGLSAYTPQLSEALLEAANTEIAHYGLSITALGNFDVNLTDEDEAQLKSLAKDTAYSRLAGSFQQYAAGEAMIGAGQGMAQGGGTGGALFAAGIGAVQGSTAMPIGAPPPPAGFAGSGGTFAQPVPGGPPPPVDPNSAAAGTPPGGAAIPQGAVQAPPGGMPLEGSVQAPPQAPMQAEPGMPGAPVAQPGVDSPGAATPDPVADGGGAPAAGASPTGVGFTHYCTECGTGIGGTVKFCPNCGTKVGG